MSADEFGPSYGSVLTTLGIRGQEADEKRRQVELALEQARFETTRTHRQYDAVDPDNRLVAGELERRWNDRLNAVHALEEEREALAETKEAVLGAADRERLLALGNDLEHAWNSTGVTAVTRKRIIRTLINEIVVRVENDRLNLVIHWEGGDHTELKVKKNPAGRHRWSTDADVVDLVHVLARQMPDKTIAAILNRSGKTTGRGNSWTRSRVCTLRNYQRIGQYREGERAERGEATLYEAATSLKVSSATVRRLIKVGVLPARQLCKGAPWVILVSDLERDDVKRAADARRFRRLTIRYKKSWNFREIARWAE